MNAVNLLPEKHRPRKRSAAGQSHSGHVALGVLGAIFVALLVYVLTLNSINSSQTKIREAKAEATRLDAEANSLGAYGDFAKIKVERVKSVQQLAEGRFDWERMVRELAHVLPSDVWLVNATAAATAADAASSPGGATGSAPSTGAAPAPAPGAAPAPAGGPVLTLQGCARDQSHVAVTLVRLRELQGAEDVSLEHSTQGEDAGGGGSTAPAAPAAGGGSDASCGSTNGKPNYSFQANVTFAPQAAPQAGAVPDRLGGGS
jgi:Tfp pilus assembly protein PilN